MNPGPGAAFSCELLWRITTRRLARERGWIFFGVALPLALALGRLVLPLDVRAGFTQVQLLAKYFALYYLAFTAVYCLYLWANPARGREAEDLAPLPLPQGQLYLQRVLEHAATPLLVFLLSLPCYLAVLVFIGRPYGQAPDLTTYLVTNDWNNWAEWHEPWGWRVFFVILTLLSSVLLPLALGVLLDDLALPLAARVPLLLGIPVAAFFLVRLTSDQYLRWDYKQYRGLSPWPFLLVASLLVLIPLLYGFLGLRGRRLLMGAALVLAAALALLPVLKYNLPGAHTTGALRAMLGDMRYALGYFVGHLSPALNIDLLMNSYPSNVLIANHRVGDLIPQHVALWVGAGLYPPLLPLALLLGSCAGLMLREAVLRRAGHGTK